MSDLVATIVNSRRTSVAFLFGVCALIYANAIGNAFQYDDRHSIVTNDHIRSLESIPEFFSHPEYFSRDEDKAMYRPLLLATFALNHSWSGYETWSYHLINIFLHALASVMVWLLFIELRLSLCLALLGGVMFAAHPLATEPVNYVSSRSELMAAFFLMASLWLYLRSQPSRALPEGRLVLIRVASVGCFAAALGSKEIGIVLPALVLLTDRLFGRPLAGQIPVYAPYTAVAMGYLLYIRSFVSTALIDEPVRSMSEQLGTQLKALPYYLKLVVIPSGLSVYHAFEISSLTEPAALLALTAIGTLVVVTVFYGARRKQSDSRSLVGFGLAWIGIVLLPTFVVPLNVLVNEHRLYLALVGALLAVLGLRRFESVRGLLWGGPVLGLLFMILVVRQNPVWSDEGSLWTHAHKRSPWALEPHVYLGNYAREQDDPEQAVIHFTDALALDPESVVARNNLANAYRDLGEWESALTIYLKVLERNPSWSDVRYNAARTFHDAGDIGAARTHYQLVDSSSYHFDLALNNLGTLFEESAMPDSAMLYYRAALERNPTNADARANLRRLRGKLPSLARAMNASGQHEMTFDLCRQLLMMNPGDGVALWVLTTTLWETGANAQSQAVNEELVRTHPTHWSGMLQLANAFETTGNRDAAAQMYEELIDRCDDEEIRKVAIDRYRHLRTKSGS